MVMQGGVVMVTEQGQPSRGTAAVRCHGNGDSRVHGEARVVGGCDAILRLVVAEHLVGVPAVGLVGEHTG